MNGEMGVFGVKISPTDNPTLEGIFYIEVRQIGEKLIEHFGKGGRGKNLPIRHLFWENLFRHLAGCSGKFF